MDKMTNVFFKEEASKKEKEDRRAKEGKISSNVKHLVEKLIRKDK